MFIVLSNIVYHNVFNICRIDEEQVANTMLSESFADYDSGQYSPQYLSLSDLEPGTLITAEEDDVKRLAFARLQVQQGTSSNSQVCDNSDF